MKEEKSRKTGSADKVVPEHQKAAAITLEKHLMSLRKFYICSFQFIFYFIHSITTQQLKEIMNERSGKKYNLISELNSEDYYRHTVFQMYKKT